MNRLTNGLRSSKNRESELSHLRFKPQRKFRMTHMSRVFLKMSTLSISCSSHIKGGRNPPGNTWGRQDLMLNRQDLIKLKKSWDLV